MPTRRHSSSSSSSSSSSQAAHARAAGPTHATARLRATQIGALAILLWAMLALLSTQARRLPPFELLALTFGVASLLGIFRIVQSGRSVLSALRQPVAAWAVGVGGLFGYHALYFFALAKAPAVHVSLIAYLWPLLLVLMSGGSPRGRRRFSSLAGAALGMGGVVLLVGSGQGGGMMRFDRAYVAGYAAALACAFTWSGYSLLNRRLDKVPVDFVAGACLVTAVLGGIVHGAIETTVVPTGREAMAVLALGAGPVGAAFLLWDHGTKQGDLPLLGVLSYATPLLSTFVLVAFGAASLSWSLGAACVLITGGAWIAARGAA
ncbi:DMT family transporter [Pendulispora albinea]|uniref:EamA family transporter n=1 Tax=Pendulispora albinea TaxID=2741071 RepID=A0ABZ2M462_9BACT